ncbi:TetR/AcrR family transcriptional regulator [Acuticoccus sp. I52.16.1]|uniref:TetR/AcrR family transcriptional regulator n=1 Tax=Acuticoccus sp. I52.16.1 TaxID=2928472 RepID=UPI001FD4FE4E|nr:TetR/AcrR family transcriptional regulator [Acuticoccus sp. I52.16.1]UOM37268.1 TetR/AcrR family transcriptional regulator [Acuticoccus sp. I52.16.1]
MSHRDPVPDAATDGDDTDTGKRKEILSGARRVFRAQGFAGASMDKIAQAAGVSKGTLYVYFRNKEELFAALVLVDRRDAAERMFQAEDLDADPRAVLLDLGERFLRLMTTPDHIALIRMVMGAAEKFPEVGRMYFEKGPRRGIEHLARYLGEQVARGRLAIDEDYEMAASHFLMMCQGTLTKRALFGHTAAPTDADVRATVESAVRVFMRAYGPERVGPR